MRLPGIYLAEAGDLAGTEVVVARGRDEWRVMYDGHPGASMPFASKTASWRADTLWFDLLLPDGRTETFFGVVQDNGLKIVREKPSLYSEVLPKRFTIDEFFAQERHGECE